MESALYDFYSLVEAYQKTHSFAALTIRFPILLNSWIKIVRAHFPWSNLYFFGLSDHSNLPLVYLFEMYYELVAAIVKKMEQLVKVLSYTKHMHEM